MFDAIKDFVAGTVSGLAESTLGKAFSAMVGFMYNWAVAGMDFLGTWWLGISTPSDGRESASARLMENTSFITWVVGVVCTIIALVQIGRSGGDREQTLDLTDGMFRVLIVSAVGLSATTLIQQWVSSTAPWLFQTVADGDENTKLSTMLRLGGGFELAAESLSMGVMLFVLPLMFVGGLVQAMLAIGTDIAAPILAALMPITAAASVINPGKKAFNTQLGWWLACLLFKLAAASIYGVGVYLIKTAGVTIGDQDSGPVVGLLSGLIIVVLAIFSLPALVRLVTPGINSVVGGNGGGRFLATAGGVAAGAALSGLVGAGASAASKGGGGGGVSQVPSGAQSNYSGGGGAGSSTVAPGGSGGGSRGGSGGGGGGSRGAGGSPSGSSSPSSGTGGSSQGAGSEDSSPTLPIGHSSSGSDPDPGSNPASEVDQSGQGSPAGASSQDSSSAGAGSGASGKGSADRSAARTGGSGATGADRPSQAGGSGGSDGGSASGSTAEGSKWSAPLDVGESPSGAGGSGADQGSAGPTPAGAASNGNDGPGSTASGRGNRSGNGARRVIEAGAQDAADTTDPEGAEQ